MIQRSTQYKAGSHEADVAVRYFETVPHYGCMMMSAGDMRFACLGQDFGRCLTQDSDGVHDLFLD